MANAAEVFISYSREDRHRVLALAAELRGAGVSLWIDEGSIDGAAMWGEEIVNALENAKVILLMVSERSVSSHNVVKEVVLASERKSHILPIHLEPTRIPPSLKYPLAGIQHIEYFGSDTTDSLRSIIRSLERLNVTLQQAPVQTAAGIPAARIAPHSMHSEVDFEAFGNAIAVLPFDNMSPDKDSDYFSDGLADELITNLSKIAELQVVSRILSMGYKGAKKDLRTIGQELHARYLVAGGVRKFGDNLRISAQLIDIASGREVWAETYKGTLNEIFDIQEEVAKKIAEALKLRLSVQDKVKLMKRLTENAEAYDLYLRGRDFLYRFTKRNAAYSIQLFEKAIQLDSRFASAYAACAEAYGQMYNLFERKPEYKDKAQELSFKALMYDNTLPEAYATLALSYYLRNDYEEAIQAGQKAIELDPEHFLSYWILGRIYYSTDRYNEAIEMFKKVFVIERKFFATLNDLKMTYDAMGDKENSAAMLKQILEFFPPYLLHHPDDARAHVFFAVYLAEAGRIDEARTEGELAKNLSPNDPLMMFNITCLYSQIGMIDEAVQMLTDAVKAGYEYFAWIKRDSSLDPIRNEPGYIELMKGR